MRLRARALKSHPPFLLNHSFCKQTSAQNHKKRAYSLFIESLHPNLGYSFNHNASTYFPQSFVPQRLNPYAQRRFSSTGAPLCGKTLTLQNLTFSLRGYYKPLSASVKGFASALTRTLDPCLTQFNPANKGKRIQIHSSSDFKRY